MLTHLTWSTLMLRYMPPLFRTEPEAHRARSHRVSGLSRAGPRHRPGPDRAARLQQGRLRRAATRVGRRRPAARCTARQGRRGDRRAARASARRPRRRWPGWVPWCTSWCETWTRVAVPSTRCAGRSPTRSWCCIAATCRSWRRCGPSPTRCAGRSSASTYSCTTRAPCLPSAPRPPTGTSSRSPRTSSARCCSPSGCGPMLAAGARVVLVSSGGMYGAAHPLRGPGARAGRLRRGGGLRTHQADAGGAHAADAGAMGGRRHRGARDAPRLGGHARCLSSRRRVPPGHGAAAA